MKLFQPRQAARRRNVASSLKKSRSSNPGLSNAPIGSRRSLRSRQLRAERLEDRCLMAGLVFDSVIMANSEAGAVYSSDMAVDGAGNTFMSGNFKGTIDFDRNASHPGNADIVVARGYGDAFVSKYGPDNQLAWVRRMGGDASESILDDSIRRMAVDAAGTSTWNMSTADSCTRAARRPP